VRSRILVAPRAWRLCTLPRAIGVAVERGLARVPWALHTTICRSNIVRALLGVTMLAEKPRA
jgi:hypothetical protein